MSLYLRYLTVNSGVVLVTVDVLYCCDVQCYNEPAEMLSANQIIEGLDNVHCNTSHIAIKFSPEDKK